MDAHHPRLRAAAAAAFVAVLTACGGADGGGTTERPAAAGSPPGAISGELLQFRRDVARQRVEVRLTATADGLVVEALTLLAPGLSAGPGDPRGARLRPGVPVDLPVVVGGDCAVDVGPPTALVRLRDAAGSVREATVPLEDDGLVQRLHEGYCFDQALLRQVAVEVVDLREVAGPALQATVRIRRLVGTEPVRLTRVDPNTVYDITAAGPLPTLSEQDEVTVVLRLDPARCDVHALGESYRTALIGLAVALGDREPRSFVLTPEPDVRQRVEAFAVGTCRGAGN